MLKDKIRNLLARDFFVKKLNRTPVENWSKIAAKTFEVTVPNSVVKMPKMSPRGGSNINIIFQLMKQTLPLNGDLAQCGVYRGATLIPMGIYLKQNKYNKNLFGFDSFEGFDSTVETDIELGGESDETKIVGGFSDTSFEVLKTKLEKFETHRNPTYLVKGYFQDSFPRYTSEKFCFVHLDCDIYESYRTCMEFFYPRMEKGGIILFDEYNDPPWIGCNKAIDEFLEDKPESPILITSDNQMKYYIAKA